MLYINTEKKVSSNETLLHYRYFSAINKRRIQSRHRNASKLF